MDATKTIEDPASNNPSYDHRRRRDRRGGLASPIVVEAAGLVDRMAGDLRAIVCLARSAALPPSGRVDEAERTATQHLQELRARLDALLGAR